MKRGTDSQIFFLLDMGQVLCSEVWPALHTPFPQEILWVKLPAWCIWAQRTRRLGPWYARGILDHSFSGQMLPLTPTAPIFGSQHGEAGFLCGLLMRKWCGLAPQQLEASLTSKPHGWPHLDTQCQSAQWLPKPCSAAWPGQAAPAAPSAPVLS